MWDGFCGEVIRRGNKRMLILAVVLLAGVALFYAFNLSYFTGFFLGSHKVAPSELLAAKDTGSFKNSLVTVDGGETEPTGVEEVTNDDSHPDGYVSARYLVTTIGDSQMFVRVDPQHDLFLGAQQKTLPSYNVTGHLKPLSEKQKDLIAKSKTLGGGNFLPFVLDAYEYKEFGWWSVVITSVIALLCLWMLVQYLQRSSDFTKHPFAKQLARHGELAMMTQQVDAECASAHYTSTHRAATAHITQHWYIVTNGMGGSFAVRLADLQWVHRMIVKRRMYFITVGKTYQINAYDRFGTKVLAPLDDAKTNETLEMLRKVAPQAIYGYDKRIQKLWKTYRKRDKSTFIPEAMQLVGSQPLGDAVTSNRYARY